MSANSRESSSDVSPPLVKHAAFWEEEKESPLLRRNGGFASLQNADELCARAQRWMDLIPPSKRRRYAARAQRLRTHARDAAMDRLFVMDAERTFVSPKNRHHHVLMLNTVFRYIKQYQQGLGFCVAFLQLFLNTEDTITMVHYMNKNLLKGYFHFENEPYVRDALVFERLLAQRDPELATHLDKCNVAWSGICSKWWVGMNLHVLPFEAIFRWYELALARGVPALFQYGFSLCQRNRDLLLSYTSVVQAAECLRFEGRLWHPDRRRDEKLEDSVVPADRDGSYYVDIVEHLQAQPITMDNINEVRREVEVFRKEEAAKREAAQAAYSDDDEIDFSDEDSEEAQGADTITPGVTETAKTEWDSTSEEEEPETEEEDNNVADKIEILKSQICEERPIATVVPKDGDDEQSTISTAPKQTDISSPIPTTVSGTSPTESRR